MTHLGKALASHIRLIFNKKEGFIPLHEPRFIGQEKEYLIDVIDSTFVSSVGKYVDKVEDKMCQITGSKHTIAAVNGTSALHIALKLAGVLKGEEVITQALTFVATANAISYCGADPVFIDVDRQTMGLSPEALLHFLQNHTRKEGVNCINKQNGKRIAAVMPMHTFGHPVQMDEICEICKQYGIPVVEDAAESLGSYYKSKHTGTIGLTGAISFNGNKITTSGGGGIILTNDSELAKLAKHLTTTAKVPHSWDFYHDMTGYNYRMPNLNAALALAQLEQLDAFLENKRQLANLYADFCNAQSIKFIHEPEDCKSNYWLNALCTNCEEETNELLTYLNEHQIMSRPIWKLLYKLPMYNECYRDEQTNAQWLEERIVNIPSSVRT